MAIEAPKTGYTGQIKEIQVGSERDVAIGGESTLPFYLFEGNMPHKVTIAFEVYDVQPDDWPSSSTAPYKDVLSDPVAWAKKCVNDYGAEMICLQLSSTDPAGLDRSAEEAAQTAKKVAEAIDVPLMVWGTANHDKDTEVLKKVCEICAGHHLLIGPLEEGDYKKIGAAAMAYGHTVIASSPIDINLAKQLNILLGNLGLSQEELIMDPTVSAIGYGIEYAYSVMERIRLAALTQKDEKLQYPLVCNIARESWKSKESKPNNDARLGDDTDRGIMLEAMSAILLALAGGDIMVMRHPKAAALLRKMINELTD